MKLYNVMAKSSGFYSVREGVQTVSDLYFGRPAQGKDPVYLTPVVMKGVTLAGINYIILIADTGFVYAVAVDKRTAKENGMSLVRTRVNGDLIDLQMGIGTDLYNANIIESSEFIYIITNRKQLVIYKNGIVKENFNVAEGSTFINELVVDIADATITDAKKADYVYHKINDPVSKVTGSVTIKNRSELGGRGKSTGELILKDEGGVFVPKEYGDSSLLFKDSILNASYLGWGAFMTANDGTTVLVGNTTIDSGKTGYAIPYGGLSGVFGKISSQIQEHYVTMLVPDVTGVSHSVTGREVVLTPSTTLPSDAVINQANTNYVDPNISNIAGVTVPAMIETSTLGDKKFAHIIIPSKPNVGGSVYNASVGDSFIFFKDKVNSNHMYCGTITDINLRQIDKNPDAPSDLLVVIAGLIPTPDKDHTVIQENVLDNNVADEHIVFDVWTIEYMAQKTTAEPGHVVSDSSTGNNKYYVRDSSPIFIPSTGVNGKDLIPPVVIFSHDRDDLTRTIASAPYVKNKFDLNLWESGVDNFTFDATDTGKVKINSTAYDSCITILPSKQLVYKQYFSDNYKTPEIFLDGSRLIGFNATAFKDNDTTLVNYPVIISKPFSFGYELPKKETFKIPYFTATPRFSNGKFYFPVMSSICIANKYLEWDKLNVIETDGIVLGVAFIGVGIIVFTSTGVYNLTTGEKLSNYVIRDDGEYVYTEDANRLVFISNNSDLIELSLSIVNGKTDVRADNLSTGLEELSTSVFYNMKYIDGVLYVLTNKGLLILSQGKWSVTDIKGNYLVDVNNRCFVYEYEIQPDDAWGETQGGIQS